MGWTHIILEGFCAYEWSKDEYIEYTTTPVEDVIARKNVKWEKRKNGCFIDSERPDWCKKHFKEDDEKTPCAACLIEKCPFFNFSEARDDDIQLFNDAWNKREEENGDKEIKEEPKQMVRSLHTADEL